MAYASVASFKRTLLNLSLNNLERPKDVFPYPFLTDYPNPQIRSLFDIVLDLERVLERDWPVHGNNSETRKCMENELQDIMWRAEDLIESYISTQLRTELDPTKSRSTASLDLQASVREMESIADRMRLFIEDARNCIALSTREIDDNPHSIVYGTPIHQDNIVGFNGEVERLKDRLIKRANGFRFVPVVGMAGIGKTTLAKLLYDDPLIVNNFPTRAWVKVSQEYSPRDFLLHLLAQITNLSDRLCNARDDALANCVFFRLSGKRFLIVLDDVRDTNFLDQYRHIFPDYGGEGRAILTTRLINIGGDSHFFRTHRVNFLNEYDSWTLLERIVFGQELSCCPKALEKPGKKIAKNCQGLPLAIIAIGHYLSKARKTPDDWNYIAESGNSVLSETEEVVEMSKQLSPSYERLPPYLKPCFIYIAAFPPQKHDISASKLIKLWVAEGFLRSKVDLTPEEVAKECLNELVHRSLVLVRKPSSKGGPKTCGLHFAMSFVFSNECRKDGFFSVMNKCAVRSEETQEQQRRLSVWNNVLFGINQDIGSFSNLRSILCPAAYHPYPLRVSFNIFKLLKVLDVVTIRFYGLLPSGIFELIHLRYLAFTYDGEEPLSRLVNLRNLQFLIVLRHLRLRYSSGDPAKLPQGIWSLHHLRHLQYVGTDLPDPCGTVLLENLSTLLDVSVRICTRQVFKKIPNLTTLGIRIELTHGDASAHASSPFEHVQCLQQLESLKCAVVNPDFGMSRVVRMPLRVSVFPPGLMKLTLSGCGFGWEEMNRISKLPNLQVLKLRCNAFRGPKWVVQYEEFPELRYLLLEDMDLVHWRTNSLLIFKKLQHLCIRHCYKLEEMPRTSYVPLKMVEIVDCRPSIDWERKIREWSDPVLKYERRDTQVGIHFSWNDKKSSLFNHLI